MLKKAIAASIFAALLCCPMVHAQSSTNQDQSGFGGAPLPSESTNTQSEEVGMNGDEPLAEPGATQSTGKQVAGRNGPNLPPARFGILSEPNGLAGLKPARYAVLSEGGGLAADDAAISSTSAGPAGKALQPARYAILSEGGGLAINNSGSAASGSGTSGPAGINLPPARYAVLSEQSTIGDSLSKLQQMKKSLPAKISASEGF